MTTPTPLTRAERSAAIAYYLDGCFLAVAAARSASDIFAAAASLRTRIAPMQYAHYCRHDLPAGELHFDYETSWTGVLFWRSLPDERWDNVRPPAATITWREMAEHVRATAEQLEMFA